MERLALFPHSSQARSIWSILSLGERRRLEAQLQKANARLESFEQTQASVSLTRPILAVVSQAICSPCITR